MVGIRFTGVELFKYYQKINVSMKAPSRILEFPGSKCPQNNCPEFIPGPSSDTSGKGRNAFQKPKKLSLPSTTQFSVHTVY